MIVQLVMHSHIQLLLNLRLVKVVHCDCLSVLLPSLGRNECDPRLGSKSKICEHLLARKTPLIYRQARELERVTFR